MSDSFLKKIIQPSFVQRAASPHATDVDTCMPVEISHFEKQGRHVVACGTDMRDGKPVRVFRAWSGGARSKRPNPMVSLSQRVAKGGVVLFIGAEKIDLPGDDLAWACSQHATLLNGHQPNEDVEIMQGEMVFLDPIMKDAQGQEGQFYNVMNRDAAQRIADEADFRTAVDTIFDHQQPDDTLILRGYSQGDGLAASARLFPEPDETALDFIDRFRTTNISLNIVGEIEVVQSISGDEILSSLSDAESDMVWELIPVSGFYKRLTTRDPEFTRKLHASGQALFEEFLLPKGGDRLGFRRALVGLKSFGAGGISRTDVCALFHDRQPALPLALVDTPHSPEMTAIIPGYREEPIRYADAGDYESQSLMSALKAEVAKDAVDFLSDAAESADQSDEFDFLDMDGPAPIA